MKNKIKYTIVSAFALFAIVACEVTNDPFGGAQGEVKAGRLELPKLRNGANDQFVEHSTTYKGRKVVTYSMEYDKSKKHSLWVAFRFDNITSEDNNAGRGSFRNDPSISSRYQRPVSGYGGAAYSRGHLVASGDIQYSREANQQTFYMTNMSPQIQNGFNGDTWANLERLVQGWGRNRNLRDTLYIVKGGTIDDAHVLEYYNNDRSKPVPKYYYMALLNRKNDHYEAIAFWMEHKRYSDRGNFGQYTISIDELEKRTGFDFFPNLPNKIENQVESSKNNNKWPSL